MTHFLRSSHPLLRYLDLRSRSEADFAITTANGMDKPRCKFICLLCFLGHAGLAALALYKQSVQTSTWEDIIELPYYMRTFV